MIFTVNNNNNISNIPVSLSTAIAQASDVIDYFTTLSPDEQQEIINYTHTIQSNQDMQDYSNKFTSFL